MESVIAACLYAACRSYNIPRTLDEMATASDVERKEIGRTYRFIIRKLGIKVKQSSPKDYISRFSSVLKLSPKTQNDALKVLKKDLDKLEGQKTLYCFTLDPLGLSKSDFVGWSDVILEPIPQKILEVYKQIYEY